MSIQLTPLQFYYSLQTESERTAAAAAVVKETEDRSSDCSPPLSSCRRAGDIHASRGRLTGPSGWNRRRSLASVDSKVASGETAKLPRRKQAPLKTERKAVAKPQPPDTGEPTTSKDDQEDVRADSDLPAKRDDQQRKCDSGRAGEVEGEPSAGSEKDCCADGENRNCSSPTPVTAVQLGQDTLKSPECLYSEDDHESSTSKSLPPASSSTTPATATAAAVSKLKIFKCSESQKLCVRSADAQASPQDDVVPKLCVRRKNVAVRRSGSAVDVRARKRDDDRRERRRRRRRCRDRAKADVDRRTVLDRTVTFTDVDGALSPVPSVPDAVAECLADAPVSQLICPAARSPLSSSDNVVSSSTSSRLLPDDEDDDVDAACRAASKSRPRRSPADDDDAGDDAKPAGAEQASAADGAGDSATTLRVPIRLGGQSGMQTGELLLRLPQNVSVQCSFRADQILIASSPATTSTEQSTVSAVADDTESLASRPHVSHV